MDSEKENDEPCRKRHVGPRRNESESKRAKISTSESNGDSRSRVVLEVAGRIRRIELENFMCHKHLEVKFAVDGNNCFYIGGPNGSGKSALFHALNLGLGGSGRDNERGRSVSDYIKEGETYAKIRITLTNRGDKAYRIDEYGDTVTVERTINKTNSTYCIKGWPEVGRERKEKIISRKKSELDVMLKFMDIQLDNPIFWMSQDRSRNFLSQMQPKKLFEIFAIATELDKIEENYQAMHEYLRDIKTSQRSAWEQNQKVKREILLLKKKRDALHQLNAQRDELVTFEWFTQQCPVRDALKKKERYEEQLKEVKQARKILKRRKEDRCQEKADLNDQIANVRQKIATFRNELEGFDVARKQLDADLQKRTNDLSISEAILQNLQDESRLWERQLKKVQASLKSIEDSQGINEIAIRIQDQKRRFAHFTAQEGNLRGQLHEAKGKIPHLNSERESLRRECNEMEAHISQLDGKIRGAERDIQFSQRIAQSDLNKFGDNTANILRFIEQHKDKFEQEPFGPIGRFISVKDEKWAFAIEQCLKNILYQYVFHSKKDESLFYDILKRNGINPPSTIISRFGLPPHDTSANEPSSQFKTIMRELSFKHPMARNILIDMRSIESILLLEGEDYARTLMREKCPENSSEAYTLDGTQIYGNTRNGQYRMYANRSRDKLARLLGDSKAVNAGACEAEMNRLKTQILESRQTLPKTRQSYSERSNQFRALEDSISKIEMELNEISRQKRLTESKVMELEGKRENNDSDIMQATYDELSHKLADQEINISESEKKVADLLEEVNCLRADLKEVKHEKRLLAAECKPDEDTFEGLEKKLGLLNGDLEASDKSLQDLEKQDNDVRDMISSADKELDQAQQRAAISSATLSVPAGFTNPPDYNSLPEMEFVEKELRRIKREIQDKESMAGGNDMISSDEISAKRQNFNATVKSLSDFGRLSKDLQEAIRYREYCLPLIKRAMAKRLHDKFEEIMHMRDFGSTVEIDFDERMIDIKVDTHNRKTMDESDGETTSPKNKKKTKNEKQDLKGLSGGERSYTTAAFVVALWEVMNAPFRCMDEFDVFMDMINRKIIMDLLVVEATTTYAHCQFLFFTPQGIKELASTERVEIYEMNKPRD